MRVPISASLLFVLASPAAPVGAERLELHIRGGDGDAPLPARVHLFGPDGKPARAPDLPFWRDHFVCGGDVALDVPPGAYEATVERGPEWRRARARIEVEAGRPAERTIRLERWIDLAARGWWSGELHVHRDPAEMELHLRAEDLHVAPVLTIWNARSRWRDRSPPPEPLVRADGDRFYHLLAAEDERQGGALLFFNLRQPIDLSGQGAEHPSPVANLSTALEQEGCRVDIEKPFWWDVPTWAATGRIDSIGLANNHMCRSTMYENEAWGRPRDAARLPAPRGNGFHTQELYYRLLNCGFRIPPSAGSASGVLPNPVGYNRIYVHVAERPLTYEAWWRGLLAGRSFVTNGPALLVEAGAGEGPRQLPGGVIRGDGPVDVEVSIEAAGNDPLEAVEVIRDGAVVTSLRGEKVAPGYRGSATVRFEQSGWFLVRAIAAVEETFRFASTAPFRVEVGGREAPPRREDVEFFIRWIEERVAAIEGGLRERLEGERLESVLAPHRRALEFYRSLLPAGE